MLYIEKHDLVQDLVTITEDGVVVTPVPDTTTLLQLPVTRRFGVSVTESKYKELWDNVCRDYPTTTSIALLGGFMLITTDKEVVGRVPDTKSYIRELIASLDLRIKNNNDSAEHVVLTTRRDLLADLI